MTISKTKLALAVTLVLVFTASIVLAATEGEVCVTRPQTFSGQCDPQCLSLDGCKYLRFPGCNDCVPGGSSVCPPVSTACKSQTGTSRCLVGSGACECSPNITWGPLIAASQGCL